MNVLVTGGAGFIGSHVTDALIKKNHNVIVVDNLATGKKSNISAQAKWYNLDIQARGVFDIVKKHSIQTIFHFAAQMNVRKSEQNPLQDARNNILGTINLLQSGAQNGIKKFIFASSGGTIYGETTKLPTKETQIPQPLAPYGVSKLACEEYIRYYERAHHMNSVILRYANVYGPRQNPKNEAGVVAIIMERILQNKEIVIYGSGKQTRDYVYIDDVVAANIHALQIPTGIFNIGTGKETNLLTMLAAIKQITKRKMRVEHGPAKRGEQKRSSLETQKAHKQLHWQAKVSLPQGLKKTWGYMLENSTEKI